MDNIAFQSIVVFCLVFMVVRFMLHDLRGK